MQRLRANTTHPTLIKFEKLIKLIRELNLELEWADNKLRIIDTDLCVIYDLFEEEDNKSINYLPPLYPYKLTRDKIPSKFCECGFCKQESNNLT